jgi:serine/threonine protein kinase
MAVFDLCNEATILGRVAPHENIVSIRGVCQASVSEAYKSHPDGWFFLEEKLQDTLADRLKEWRRELEHHVGYLDRLRYQHSISSLKAPSEQERGIHQLLSMAKVYDRLQNIALGVANAMKHLHSEPFQIVFRDLKPQNIGFDSHGIVKLFDLGMAGPIKEIDTMEVAGTYRYLSPESLSGKPISFESDVYSFGVILYELATLGKPFDQYFQRGKFIRKEAFCNDVVTGGWRPDLSHIFCRDTARLISKCWDPSPPARPSFERIHDILLHILASRENSGEAAVTAKNISLSGPQLRLASSRNPDSSLSPCLNRLETKHAPATSHFTFRGFFRGRKPSVRITEGAEQ